MRNLFIILFVVIASTFVDAQNTDKLTLKGGIMLGVPSFSGYNHEVVGMCGFIGCDPTYNASINFNASLSPFLQLDYFFKNKALNNSLSIQPYTGFGFALLTSRYDYVYEYKYSGDKIFGTYSRANYAFNIPLGVRLNLKNSKFQFLTGINNFLMVAPPAYTIHDSPEANAHRDNYNNFRWSGFNVFQDILLITNMNLEARYKIDERFTLLMSYTTPGNFVSRVLSWVRDTDYETLRRNDFYQSHNHQITLGVTYQLLSHKNKTEESKE